MGRLAIAVLVALAALVLSFFLTNYLYVEWAVWRYPETNSMAGMGGLVLSLVVAPIFALAAGVLVLCGGKPPDSN